MLIVEHFVAKGTTWLMFCQHAV